MNWIPSWLRSECVSGMAIWLKLTSGYLPTSLFLSRIEHNRRFAFPIAASSEVNQC